MSEQVWGKIYFLTICVSIQRQICCHLVHTFTYIILLVCSTIVHMFEKMEILENWDDDGDDEMITIVNTTSVFRDDT